MKKKPFIILFFFSLLISGSAAFSQNADEKAILKVIEDEVVAWNKGDIEGYVQFYTPDDSCRMISRSGITYGRDSILAFYKKHWPKERMGVLTLDQTTMERISDTYYFVTGRFTVVTNGNTIVGRYSSLMKKVNGRWYIYTDHSA